MANISLTRDFQRWTPSTKNAVFYAACSAVRRGSTEIEPDDLFLGLVALPHGEDCGFRKMFEQRQEMAAKVGLSGVDSETVAAFRANRTKTKLSVRSGAVLRGAWEEADRMRQFWIDNDHLQIALASHDARFDDALSEGGYTIAETRRLGEEGRSRHPPKPPTLVRRAKALPRWVWFIAYAVLGFVGANLFGVLLSKVH